MTTQVPQTAPARPDVVVRRALGLVIDVLATGAVGAVVAEGLEIGFHSEVYGGMTPTGHVVAIVLGVAVWLGAFVVIPAAGDDRTLGMRLVGVRVVRADDGGRPGAAAHLVRFLCLIVDGLVGGLVGLLIILRSPSRRRLGDMAAGTLVVGVDR